MTALSDAERTTVGPPRDRTTLIRANQAALEVSQGTSWSRPAWLPSRGFIAAVIAIAGMQLMATMDGTIAIVALPKIQNELNLADAGRSWVITASVLTFGGLMLLGGRLGDASGRKRTFIAGVALFIIASILCGLAWDEATLVIARLLQGVGADIASPTALALIATTFPKGPARNAATAIFAAMTGIGSVMGLIVGGALTEEGWRSPVTIGSGIAALVFLGAFALAERTADNPLVPFDTFRDRTRLATFAAIFLAGGVMFTLTVLIGLYVQEILGYSALRAGVGFIPFVIALGLGLGISSQLVSRFSPRVLTIGGGWLLVLAMLYGSLFMHRGVPYFPNLIVPIVVGSIGIGMVTVPLMLSAIAGVGFDRIGPVSALTLMLQSLGGPLVLAVIQAVITSRTLYLGGTTGPVKFMNDAQLRALDHGYTYGLLWVAGAAVIVGGAALFIGYTPQQVAQAQEGKDAIDSGEI